MGWVMAGLGFHGLDMPKFIRPMTHPSSGPPQPSPFPARPIGLGQGSAMGWWAEPKPMRTIDETSGKPATVTVTCQCKVPPTCRRK